MTKEEKEEVLSVLKDIKEPLLLWAYAEGNKPKKRMLLWLKYLWLEKFIKEKM